MSARRCLATLAICLLLAGSTSANESAENDRKALDLIQQTIDKSARISLEGDIDGCFEKCYQLYSEILWKHVHPLLRHRPDLQQSIDGAFSDARDKATHLKAWALREVVFQLRDELNLPFLNSKKLTGHRKDVAAVAFSPRGDTLASADLDGKIIIWNAETGTIRSELAGQPRVFAIAFSKDGKTLASAGTDSEIWLWDLPTGKVGRRFDGQGGHIASLAYSPDGRILASGGYDKSIRLWDCASGQEIRKIHGLEGRVTSLAFSPDGRRLVSGGAMRWTLVFEEGGSISTGLDAPVHLWEVSERKEYRDFPSRGNSIAFSPDGRMVASGGLHPAFRNHGRGRTGFDSVDVINLQDSRSGESLFQMKWRGKAVTFSPDGKFIATGRGNNLHSIEFGICSCNGINGMNHDDTLRLWEVTTRKEVVLLSKHFPSVMAFSPDGNTLATGNSEGQVFLCSLTSSENDKPSDEELVKLWQQLSGEDAMQAYRAISRLVATPRTTVALLKKNMRRVSDTEMKGMEKLIVDLEHEQVAIRQAAAQALEKFGVEAETALLESLGEVPEVDRLIQVHALVKRINKSTPGPDVLRKMRALHLLERIASTDALQFLEELAKGSPRAWLTLQAKQSLERVGKRGR